MTSRSRVASFAIIAALSCATPLLAHHGKDFLLVESYEVPESHSMFFLESDAAGISSDGTSIEDEPSILLGASRRIAFELHAHLAKQSGESYRYEAFAPAIHVQLTDPASESLWKFGASAEYEVARERSEDRAELRAIGQRAVGEGALVVNVIGSHARGGDSSVGYAVGYRPQLESRTSWGVEASGELKRHAVQEAVLGIYHESNERVTWKLGAGVDAG